MNGLEKAETEVKWGTMDEMVYGAKPSHKELMETLRATCKVVDCVQERPYTYVHVLVSYRGEVYEANGFSKVMWPDVFDYDKGIKIATDHALWKIVRAIRRRY